MSDLRTTSPDELPEISEIPEGLRALVFSPAGPLQALPYERLLTKLIATDLAKPSKAALDADLAHEADSVALVFGDAQVEVNGWYRKIGASGAGGWEQFEELSRNSRLLAQAAAQAAQAAEAAATSSAQDLQSMALLRPIGIDIPQRGSFRTAVGRLKRIAAGVWAKCNANEPRVWIAENGGLEGVMMHPGGNYVCPDWTVPPANSAAPAWATTSNAELAITQVKSHTDPDMFGGTGAFTRIAGASISALRTAQWPNMTRAVVSGNTLRLGFLLIGTASGSARTVALGLNTVSGASITGTITVQIATDGTMTLSGGANDASTRLRLIDTLPGGQKLYRVFRNYAISATGTYSPRVQASTGADFTLLAAPWFVLNPAHVVEPIVPPFATGDIVEDDIRLGTAEPIDVMERRQLWGRSRITDGRISPFQSVATDPFGIQRVIEVRPSGTDENRNYIPGSGDGGWDRLAPLFVAGASLWLGDGQFPPLTNFFSSITLRGVHADPARWPEVCASGTFLGGGAGGTLERLVFNPTVGQRLNNATSGVVDMRGVNFALRDVVAIGVDIRYRPDLWTNEPEWGALGGGFPNFFGRGIDFGYTDAGNVADCTFMAYRCNGGVEHVFGGGAAAGVNFQNCIAIVDTVAADAFKSASSVLSFDSNCINGAINMSAVAGDTWQTQTEIEVNDGTGWKTLTTAGYTVANLPRDVLMELVGTTGSPDNLGPSGVKHPMARLLLMDYPAPGNAGRLNKPGFQFRSRFMEIVSPNAEERSWAQRPEEGMIFERANPGTPSPTNLNVRLRFNYGYWPTGGGPFIPGSTPARTNTAAHADFWQITGTGLNMTANASTNIQFKSQSQVIFWAATGNTASAIDMKLIAFSSLTNGAGPGPAITPKISGVLLPQNTTDREAPANFAYPVLRSGATGRTVNAGNLFISENSGGLSVNISDGGTFAPGPTGVSVGRLGGGLGLGDTFIPPATDQPGERPTMADLVPLDQIENGMLARHVDWHNVRFSAYANRVAGFDMNVACARASVAHKRLLAAAEAAVTPEPTHTCRMAASAATVGTFLPLLPFISGGASAIIGTRFDPIRGGNGAGKFAMDGGRIRVVVQPTAGEIFVLRTDAGEVVRAYFV